MSLELPSRRSFMAAAGAGLLASTLRGADAPPLAPPDKQPPKLEVPPGNVRKARWAIVGLGQLALEEVMPAFGLCRQSIPTALVSGHPEKAQKVADTYGVDRKHLYTYDTFDKIANDDQIDIVYVILPNHMHAEYTIRALKAGKHVLCEKPLSATVEEARDMCAVAKQTGKKLMAAYRLRYEPFTQTAIGLVREQKKLGKPKLITAMNSQMTKAPNIRLSKQTAGGPVMDVGVYCIQAARYMTGEEPYEVMAMLHKPDDDPNFREVAESYSWLMKFPSGVVADCSCGLGTSVSRMLRVACSDGVLHMNNAFAYRNQELLTTQGDQQSKHQIEPVDHFAAEMDYFSDCVLNDKQVLTPGEDGLADMIVIDAVHRSADTRSIVAINEGPGRSIAGERG
jgi:predicted dehydrogenase